MTKKKNTWKNPLAILGAKGGNYEVPTPPYKDPHEIWKKTNDYLKMKVKLYNLTFNQSLIQSLIK